MSEHYPGNVVGVLKWCNHCRKQTMHAVSGKKATHCQEHAPTGMSKKQEAAAKKREKEAANLKLF